MIKKYFTESQIILFVALFGLCMLMILPVSNKLLSISKERQYEKNIDAAIEASRNYIDDNKKVERNLYIDISDLVKLKYLSKEKISGCVKITYDEKRDNYGYTYSPNECKDIMTIKDVLLNNVVSSKDGLYKIGNEYRFKGANPNNYILINKVMYRILLLNDSGIKIIRNDNVLDRKFDGNTRLNDKNSYCLNSIYGCNMYTSNGIEVIEDSEIHQYLETVYKEFVNSNIILNDTSWQTGLVNNNYDIKDISSLIKKNNTTSKVGLISINDYILASLNSNYTIDNWLNNHTNYWTITGVLDNNYDVFYINSNGLISYKYASDIAGVRPVINISSKLKVNGEGTYSNPYVINIK